MASGRGRPGKGGFSGCPSPLRGEEIRLARSRVVGLGEIGLDAAPRPAPARPRVPRPGDPASQ